MVMVAVAREGDGIAAVARFRVDTTATARAGGTGANQGLGLVFKIGLQALEDEIEDKIPSKNEMDAPVANRMEAGRIQSPRRGNMELKIRAGAFVGREVDQVFFVAGSRATDVPP